MSTGEPSSIPRPTPPPAVPGPAAAGGPAAADPARAALRGARVMLAIVAGGLFISGATIFPALPELRLFVRLVWGAGPPGDPGSLHAWVLGCIEAIARTSRDAPCLFYAGDWLAFAHIMLAVLFLGAARDPARNVWVVRFGLLCCLGILPVAWICGPLRGIPPAWRLIDTAFAPLAAAPLLRALVLIRRIEGDAAGTARR